MCESLPIARRVSVGTTATAYHLPQGYVWRDLRLDGDVSLLTRLVGSQSQNAAGVPGAVTTADLSRDPIEGFDINPSLLTSLPDSLQWRNVSGGRLATLIFQASGSGTVTIIGAAVRPCGACGG